MRVPIGVTSKVHTLLLSCVKASMELNELLVHCEDFPLLFRLGGE